MNKVVVGFEDRTTATDIGTGSLSENMLSMNRFVELDEVPVTIAQIWYSTEQENT